MRNISTCLILMCCHFFIEAGSQEDVLFIIDVCINFCMKMKYIFVLLILACLSTSCLSDKSKSGMIIDNGSLKVISIDSRRVDHLNWSSVVKSMKLIFLETQDSSLLSEISKIEIDEDKFFIQNKKDKLIYVFDVNGDFQYVIGRKGNGPTEIQNPECFTLNKRKKEVWLINNYSFIYKYNYLGELLSKEPLKLFFKDFIVSNDGSIYFHASKMLNYTPKTGEPVCWNLWNQSRNGKAFNTYFRYDPTIYPNGSTYFDTKTPFSLLEDSIIYHYVFSDTIYSILEGNVSPKYVIDFGKNASSVNLNEIPGEQALNYLLSEKGQAFYVHDVIETSDFLKFKYFVHST